MKITYNVKYEKASTYWQEHQAISHLVSEQYENVQFEYATEIMAHRASSALYRYLKKNKLNYVSIKGARTLLYRVPNADSWYNAGNLSAGNQ